MKIDKLGEGYYRVYLEGQAAVLVGDEPFLAHAIVYCIQNEKPPLVVYATTTENKVNFLFMGQQISILFRWRICVGKLVCATTTRWKSMADL